MIEISAGELCKPDRFKSVFAAIPLPEDIFPSWVWQLMFMIEKGRFSELRNKNNFLPHMTLFYFGLVDEKTLNEINDFVRSNSDKINNTAIQTTHLQIIGDYHKALVLGVEKNEDIVDFRKKIENTFPQFQSINLPLNPHFTITEIRTRRSLERARKMVLARVGNNYKNTPFKPDVGIKLFFNKL